MNTNRLLMTPREKLALWWWGLPEKERAAIREQVVRRFHTDPVFHTQVRKAQRDEQDAIDQGRRSC